jgi:hypothetical protein
MAWMLGKSYAVWARRIKRARERAALRRSMIENDR